MDDAKLAAIVDAIVRELKESGAVKPNVIASPERAKQSPASSSLSVPSSVPVKPRATTTATNYQLLITI